jgi:uncharacterized SAM-binding protein YcdF (DUF218 family)
MFALSKIFWIVLNPANIFVFFLLLGTVLLFTRFRRSGRRVLAATVGIFVVLGFLPVGFWLTGNLENRFPVNPPIPEDIAGIVTLGGTINQYITAARGQPALSEGGERLTEFVHLARRFPGARLIFTGGSGALIDTSMKEADAAQVFFNQMGLSDRNIMYENRARNTYENALLSKELVGEDAIGKQWVLITSAAHMPRAIGVFRQTGWNIIAYPVDYITDGRGGFEIQFQPMRGLSSLNSAMREWIGLMVYRALGRTQTLVPSPGSLSDN